MKSLSINTWDIVEVTSEFASPVSSFVDIVKRPCVGVLTGYEPSEIETWLRHKGESLQKMRQCILV